MHVLDQNDDGSADVCLTEHHGMGEILDKFREKVPKTMGWKASMANDVGNSGNAHTHATGNRQRCENGITVSTKAESPAEKNENLEINYPTNEGQHDQRDRVQDVLNAEAEDQVCSDPFLAECGVPDTACRRPLVGAYTLSCIQRLLSGQGFRIPGASERNDFRFGQWKFDQR